MSKHQVYEAFKEVHLLAPITTGLMGWNPTLGLESCSLPMAEEHPMARDRDQQHFEMGLEGESRDRPWEACPST